MRISASNCSGAAWWSTGGCSSSRCGVWLHIRPPGSPRHDRTFGSSERQRCSCSVGASRAAPTCRNTHSSDGRTASSWESSSPNTSRPVTARFSTAVYGVSLATSTMWARDSFPFRLHWYSATSLIPGREPILSSSSRFSPDVNVKTRRKTRRITAPRSGQSTRHE